MVKDVRLPIIYKSAFVPELLWVKRDDDVKRNIALFFALIHSIVLL